MKTIAIALLTTALLSIGVGTASAAPHTPCKTEDSTNCVRDAKHSGNGQGRSYLVRKDGTVKYITHRRAHNLIFTPRLDQDKGVRVTFAPTDPCAIVIP